MLQTRLREDSTKNLSYLGNWFLNAVPPDGICWSCCYGSQVMESALLSQLDMIIAIQDSKIQAWHEKNLIINWDHYSIWARGLGLNFVMYLQNYGAGVYFHPYISFRDNNTQYKYGAIALSTLVKDLTEWEHFYIAGRLHKPVLQLQNNSVVAEAQSKNLNSALSVALLLLPHQFSEDDLYKTIAGLSYTGDIRMKFGENPQKIENIVSGNTEHFRQLYSPHLEKFAASDIIKMYKPNSGSFTIEQDFSKHNALMLILPKNLKEQMLKFHTPNQGEDFFFFSYFKREDQRGACTELIIYCTKVK